MTMQRLMLFVVAFAASPWVAAAGTVVDERKAADPNGEVEISNVSGSVNVQGWGRDEIEVTGELGRNVERLDFIRDGDHTLIKVIYPNRGSSSGSDLEISVPLNSSLVITGVSADVGVRKVQGAQRIATVSGDLDIEVAGEDLEAKTVSGDLTVLGQNSPAVVTVTTVSGDATLSKVAGEVMVTSVSGDLGLSAKSLNRARLKTTNGDIEASAELMPDGNVDIDTINGDVELAFNRPDDFELDIETLNGDIENCLGIDSVRKSRYGPGRYLRHSVGDGSRQVRIETLNGDVEVCAD